MSFPARDWALRVGAVVVPGVLGLLLVPGEARAFNLASGFTDPCHEELSLASLEVLVGELDEGRLEVALPSEDLWTRAADEHFRPVRWGELQVRLDEPKVRFIALSLLLGVRYPDTANLSVTDPGALRHVHAAPDPESQHAHCLRAAEDDGASADQDVLAWVTDRLSQGAATVADLLLLPVANQNRQVELFFEFSGPLPITVHGPSYELGLALHSLQDSYSHTIRSDDGRHVLTVLNFVEAAAGTAQRHKDGEAHSRAMDQCRDPELQTLVLGASQASAELTRAALALRTGDSSRLARGLRDCTESDRSAGCGWLSYAPDCVAGLASTGSLAGTCCSPTTEYCGSKWLPKVQEAPTQPLHWQVFGCHQTRGIQGGSSDLMVSLGCLFALGLLRRQKRGLAGFMAVVAGSAHAEPPPTRALADRRTPSSGAPQVQEATSRKPQQFLAVEAHGSLLSSGETRGLSRVTVGPGIRAGIRSKRPSADATFGAFLSLEQSSWLRTETTLELGAGVLDAAVGVELLYFQGLRSSLAVGPSLLLMNVPARDAGTVGLFLDVRPLGLRLPLGRHTAINLDPLTITWVAPATGAPTVQALHYRFVLGVELSN